ncbi:hypothetical protein G7Y89_g13783 [Cudoniella acicularis]|uniref:Major facilitator superfamily (MFS) profile domain-containing protein n=1 Tax=Cudoniella acicularis TaxID=354080 RepID=A0A8H4VXW6_9HELO|nr:hypothetical protein G7Y89_g13783 [Cudoniella acicularis]
MSEPTQAGAYGKEISSPSTLGLQQNENHGQGGESPAMKESLEARLDRLGRQRPEVFDSTWAEIGFVFSISMSQVLSEYFVSGFTVILPTLAQDLHIPAASSTWPASAFSLVVASFLLVFGRFADMYGSYPIYVGGLAWLAAWSLIAGFSTNDIMLNFCRAFQGLGSAAFLPLSVMILGNIYRPGPRKNLVFSIYGACAPTGFFIGIFFAGVTAEYTTWSWYFWIGGILAAIAALTSYFSIPSDIREKISAPDRPKMDWLGSFLIVCGLILFTFAIIDSSHAPQRWKTPYIYILFIFGLLLLLCAVYVEIRHAEEPLLPGSLFKVPCMSALVIALFFTYGSLGIFLLYGTFYMEEVMGASPLQVVAWYVPMALGGCLISTFGGFVLHRIPGTILIILAGTSWIVAPSLFAIAPQGASYWAYIFPSMICATVGIDITFNVANIFITTSLPQKQQGLAGCVIMLLLHLGIAVCLGFADIINTYAVDRLGTRKSYHAVFWFEVACAATALIILVLFVKIKKAESELTVEEREKLEAEDNGVYEAEREGAATSNRGFRVPRQKEKLYPQIPDIAPSIEAPTIMDLFNAANVSEQTGQSDHEEAEWEMGALPVNNSTERQSRKLRRSCELCRTSKGRCLKEGKKCIFLEAKPRPKRAKNSRIRVAEMEEKLEGLVALLTSTTHATKESLSTTLPTTVSVNEKPHPIAKEPFPSQFPPSRLQNAQVPIHYSVFPFPDTVYDDLNDPISRGIVSFERAEQLVRIFRTKAPKFPFVLIPPQMSLDTLRRERPFFLLSVLTYTSQSTVKVQKELELELKESLSKRIFIDGEKSLDLLQGLLIYILSYHFFFLTNTQQVYQLVQMAVTMTVDLGINKPTRDRIPSNLAILSCTPLAFLPKRSSEELESRRTFLGCYFVVTSKPANITYNEYMSDCCEALSQAADAETDHLIPYFIKLQRLVEEVNHAFNYNTNLQLSELETVRIEILLKAFEDQLKSFETTFPAKLWDNTAIMMSFFAVRIYIYEIGFHAKVPANSESMSTHSNHRSWYFAAARNKTLTRCLQAAKDYLDRFMLLSPPDIFDFMVQDFVQIVYAILILGAFTTPLDAPTLDHEHARETANVGHYLDLMINKIADIAIARDDNHNPYLHNFNILLRQSRIWYVQSVNGISAGGSPFSGNTDLDFMNILPVITTRCVDWCVAVGQSEEQWAEIFSNWPSDLSTISMDSSFE